MHPPLAVYLLLHGMGLAGSLAAGWSLGRSAARSWLHVLVFAGERLPVWKDERGRALAAAGSVLCSRIGASSRPCRGAQAVTGSPPRLRWNPFAVPDSRPTSQNVGCPS